jgi:peptide/nickel transport system permease protein
MLVGARSLVVVSGSTALVALALGVTWGLFAAYLGGFQDELLMRGVDIAISVPEMLIAIVVLTVFGSSDITVIIAVAIVFAPYVARIVRSAALTIVAQEYVDAARAAGERSSYILFREVLPNLQSVLLVEAAVRLSLVVLLVASLGYLGLGVQPPTPDWGLMVSDSQDYIVQAPWLVLFPALGIGLIVVSCHSLADRVAATSTQPGARDVLAAAALGEIG